MGEGGSGTPVEEVEEDLRGRLITRSKVWDGEGLVAHVSCASYPDHVGREVEVVATFTNSSHVAYTFFICRAATPRYLNVTMGASKVRGGHRSGKEEGGGTRERAEAASARIVAVWKVLLTPNTRARSKHEHGLPCHLMSLFCFPTSL